MHVYLIVSVALLGLWLVFYLARPLHRRDLLRVSLWSMTFGVAEPFFVPRYWSPPTLWDLAGRTGFDVESLIFSFANGGVLFAIYDVIFRRRRTSSRDVREHPEKPLAHRVAVFFPPALFLVFVTLTGLNPIYAACLGLAGGSLVMLGCRPDFWPKMAATSGLVGLAYSASFLLFDAAFPGYAEAVWNLKALSGWQVWGLPVEELLFALAFGFFGPAIYEYLT